MMRLKACFGVMVVAVGFALGAADQARADQVLTFDDLSGSGGVIPDGYGGFHWNNFNYLDGSTYSNYPSGYQNGIVSPNNVAYNAFADNASMSVSNPNVFTFNSVYLTGAWNDGLNVKVDGYLGASLLYSQTVTVNTSGPINFTFDYVGIDSLTFSSFGGTNHGYDGQGEHFVMDNFRTGGEVGAVPEPSSVISAAVAVAAGLGFGARRRRRAVA